MPIAVTDMAFFRSTPSGEPNTKNQSIGGAISAVQIYPPFNDNPASPTYNRFMRDFGNDDRDEGISQYHCIFLKNKHATLTATQIKVWFSAVTPNPDTYSRMGLDPNPKNTSAVTIPNEWTSPDNVDFDTRHNAPNEAIAFPDLAPNDYKGLWVEIEVKPNSAKYNKDWFEIRVELNTPA